MLRAVCLCLALCAIGALGDDHHWRIFTSYDGQCNVRNAVWNYDHNSDNRCYGSTSVSLTYNGQTYTGNSFIATMAGHDAAHFNIYQDAGCGSQVYSMELKDNLRYGVSLAIGAGRFSCITQCHGCGDDPAHLTRAAESDKLVEAVIDYNAPISYVVRGDGAVPESEPTTTMTVGGSKATGKSEVKAAYKEWGMTDITTTDGLFVMKGIRVAVLPSGLATMTGQVQMLKRCENFRQSAGEVPLHFTLVCRTAGGGFLLSVNLQPPLIFDCDSSTFTYNAKASYDRQYYDLIDTPEIPPATTTKRCC